MPMPPPVFSPPLTSPAQLASVFAQQGYLALSPAGFSAWSGCDLAALTALQPTWDSLPPDAFLKDGGHYRHRRHSCFVVDESKAALVPHRAHWQSLDYNALHGGMERLFEPIQASVINAQVWQSLLCAVARVANLLKTPPPQSAHKNLAPWFVEAHQFRIDTKNGIGRPTPEGAHRDGVDLVAVILVNRAHVKGGETRVFEAQGTQGQRFTLLEPWTVLFMDDKRVIHETTPIQAEGSQAGWRDTLVLTYREKGFQTLTEA